VVDVANTSRRLPRWLTGASTPDRLRRMAIITVAVIVAVGVTAWFLTDRLVSQTNEVATSTGEVLIATQQVSASFAEADAAAVSVHLAGADGNREQRRLFEQAVDRATTSLERVSRLVGDDEPSHDALQEIASQATKYTGLIEAARLASIEDLSGADVTLRQASEVNRSEISPEVEVISTRARSRFSDQTSSSWYLVAIVLLVVALLVLVAMQYLLSKQFRRLINVPLALASGVLIVLIFVSANGFARQQTALSNAESQAFDAIVVSQEIQETAYLHRAIGTTAVLSGEPAGNQLASLEAALASDSDLLDAAFAAASSDRERAAATEIAIRWDRYAAQTTRMQTALQQGDVDAAERIAQGSANSTFNGFNTSVEAALLDNREQFLQQLNVANDELQWLRGFIFIGSLLAALLAWWGFALRIGEYR